MPPRAPDFWMQNGLAARLLAPVAALYGALAARRMRRRPEARSSVPVVAVGNFVMGGAGKTPTALALAGLAAGRGAHPAIVLRGYGGTARGPVRVDPDRHDATQVGDEAAMIAARGVPAYVARDRRAGIRLAAAEGADLVILDDGFQNGTIGRDLALVVVDGGYGLGNGRVFPAGPLRAPIAVQAGMADLVLRIGQGAGVPALPGFAGATMQGRLVARDPAGWRGRRVLAFAGIGRPEKFGDTLAALGADVAGLRPFPDHHAYSEGEARRLLVEAAALGAELVTTEKDIVRLAGFRSGARAELAARTAVLTVDLAIDDPAALVLALDRLLGPVQR
ncbi:tetraacyldisaccharide 4'-kinase [Prosthecodimorpha staleyi]|uniref:Tetraacyldisaccharide 4'-kinase n=1 Tax=Prosthecodimorpha staleyi TaxID=2840188 RepID=A0A947D1W4_9HYPH|nr:tetraacyldisaccharide 4'-kinase [Prosthecodimorpha staleyi]MBT9289440.1 tetraacyldisaccharide 4'-kinase [Prosthecodimorpha staleyi]